MKSRPSIRGAGCSGACEVRAPATDDQAGAESEGISLPPTLPEHGAVPAVSRRDGGQAAAARTCIAVAALAWHLILLHLLLHAGRPAACDAPRGVLWAVAAATMGGEGGELCSSYMDHMIRNDGRGGLTHSGLCRSRPFLPPGDQPDLPRGILRDIPRSLLHRWLLPT
jgi:hypothetical protein